MYAAGFVQVVSVAQMQEMSLGKCQLLHLLFCFLEELTNLQGLLRFSPAHSTHAELQDF